MNRVNQHSRVSGSKDEKVVKEWINLMNTFEWTHFTTFTTCYPLSLSSARTKMERMANYISQILKQNLTIFWVAEPHKSDGYHIHALFNIEDKKNSTIKKVWDKVSGSKPGNSNKCTVEVYQKGMGGAGYTVKNLMSEKVDYDISIK